ncbi:MAG TPA: retropepsin-like aspartic protease [Solimonas sp.]|nr:retropepsin-like aspartic protease [Solimonas sp.]
MDRRFLSLLSALALVPVLAWSRPPVIPISVELDARESGTFYVQGEIAGFGESPLLVDTGSSLTVITESMLATLLKSHGAEFSHELAGMMADGSTRLTKVYRLAGLRLGESCWIADVDAAIFPNGSRAILGMNVLSRLTPFTLSVDPPALALSRCSAPEALRPLPSANDRSRRVPADAAAALIQ